MRQDVFLRHEKKYLVEADKNQQLLQMISARMQPDQYGLTRVDSLYLDTPSYLLTRQSIESPMYKEKIRIRTYDLPAQSQLQDPKVFVEQKKKLNGVVYKRRIAMTLSKAFALINLAAYYDDDTKIVLGEKLSSQIANELFWASKRYQSLQPLLQISCDRLAFVEKGAAESGLRITLDSSLNWQPGSWSFVSNPGYGFPLNGGSMMEIKLAGPYPLWLSRMLDDLDIYPTSFSKVGTAYKLAFQEGLLS
ncbi:MAG: polyphosphate polymerase domain-containing protein [Coriobacteriaceae bacterium]|nr:polyphosphate polymerase domain-containing protein [Coriobacteriaceae bacterium]